VSSGSSGVSGRESSFEDGGGGCNEEVRLLTRSSAAIVIDFSYQFDGKRL
jgi:hypothetical protein